MASLKLTLPVVLLLLSCHGFAQNARELFGKNTVQYNDDLYDWSMYETHSFIVYYYGKSKSAARFLIQIAESENEDIQKLFEYHTKDKIELFVYADPSDLAQSNIRLNLSLNEQDWETEPKVKDNKILLSFNGSHPVLRKQLRSGLIRLYFKTMFDGTALQDAVQKALSFKLPDWFETGLNKYLVSGWDQDAENSLLHLWKAERFKKFSKKHAELAGQSFWHFLAESYGEQAIPNWLYMTRIQKDVYNAAQLVFSAPFEHLETEWFSFYDLKSSTSRELGFNPIKEDCIKLKKEEQINSVTESKEVNKLLLSTQQNGKLRVRLFDINTNKSKTIFRYGSRSKLHKADTRYPVVCYNKYTDKYIVFFERRNRVYMQEINSSKPYKKSKRIKLPEDIRQIYSTASYDKNQYILNANTTGFSDIYLYNTKTRQHINLTDDAWDDLDVSVFETDSNKIIAYLSNKTARPIDSTTIQLPLEPYKLSLSKLNAKNKLEPVDSIILPKQLKLRKFKVLENKLLLNVQSPVSFDWIHYYNNHSQNLKFNSYPTFLARAANSSMVHTIIKQKNKYYLKDQKLTIVSLNKVDSAVTGIKEFTPEKNLLADTILGLPSDDSLYFQSPFGNPANLNKIYSEFIKKTVYSSKPDSRKENQYTNLRTPDVQLFEPNKAIAYRNRYTIDELTMTLDNEILFSGLNNYTAGNVDYEPPELGILFKSRILEILENHIFEAGLRIPTTFDGFETFLSYNNRKKHLDHTYSLYFKTKNVILSNLFLNTIKLQTNTWLLNHQLIYPLDHYRSLRAISSIRSDHGIYLSTSPATLFDSSEIYQQRIGTRLEYVFDNALERSINLRSGWQMKIFFEASKKFELNPKNKSRIYPGMLLLAGFDARLHIPVFKKSIFSNRLFINASFGKDRILFHTGGTENWIIPKFDSQAPIETSGEYVYSNIATEVRGHNYGSRKGSSVLGFSSELRVPFLQYLISQNWKNSFLRNFQLVGFYDAARVWDGLIPNSNSGRTLYYTAQNPAVKIDLEYKRNVWISGTGLGLRNALFGYFFRLDYAWQVDNFKLSGPRWIFSLGLDF